MVFRGSTEGAHTSRDQSRSNGLAVEGNDGSPVHLNFKLASPGDALLSP
jgi:hypothetical protein